MSTGAARAGGLVSGNIKVECKECGRVMNPGALGVHKRTHEKDPFCKFEFCNNLVFKRGFCSCHYRQLRKYDWDEAQLRIIKCLFEDCDGIVQANGYCRAHYWQLKRADGDTALLYARQACCLFKECEQNIFARGYCRRHYKQLYVAGFDESVLVPIQSTYGLCTGGLCLGPKCDRIAATSGYCSSHYRQIRSGEILRPTEAECEICGEYAFLVRDHNHACCGGKERCGNCERGNVCRRCNVTLGFVKDDPIILLKLIDYLMQTNMEIYI